MNMHVAEVEADHVDRAIAALTSSVNALRDMVVLENRDRDRNLDRMANNRDFDALCKSLSRLQLVASSVEIRIRVNVEMGPCNRK